MSEHSLPLRIRIRIGAVGVTKRQKARAPVYRMKARGTFYPWGRWLEVKARRLRNLKIGE